MKLVILAAGMGSRLGKNLPKAIIKLSEENDILACQLNSFNGIIDTENVIVVVGYKKELIIEQHPSLNYVFNANYATTNTSKSLLCALNEISDEDVVFINGDVVFSSETARKISHCSETTFMVNTDKTAEEEVKYRLNESGKIIELSKQVINANGEAVGINYISRTDLLIVKKELYNVDDMDYFEKAFENLIKKDVIKILPTYVGDEFVCEVDFEEDLIRASQYLHGNGD